MTGPPRSPHRLLESALHADPARALLTYYDDATGERTELSVATFANWVAKTANLCRDELGLTLGARVVVALPPHWLAAVWWQACWSAGLVVWSAPPQAGEPEADLAVVALGGADTDDPAHDVGGAGTRAAEVVGLGLGPMGLPVTGRRPPAGVLDYDREITAHGDRFSGSPPAAAELPALERSGTALSGGGLVALAEDTASRWAVGSSDRIMTAGVTPGRDPVLPVMAQLLVPLASGCGVVLCRHADRLDDPALERRAGSERVTAVTSDLGLRVTGARPLD